MEGHKQLNCRRQRCVQEGRQDNKNLNVNGVFSSGGRDTMTSLEDEWICDSGATYHITNRRDYFTSFKEEKSQITVGNGEKIDVIDY